MNPIFQKNHEWRWERHHHRPHRYSAARAVTDLRFSRVELSFNNTYFKVIIVMKNSGTFTAPVARKDGTPLTLPEIDHFSLTRNGVEIQRIPPTDAVINWSDTTPITGSDDYEVFTITTDGFISDASNDLVITVPTANPASAITDLQGNFSVS